MDHSFVRLGVGIPRVTVADCEKNLVEIKALIDQADAAQVDVLVFPELALTGSTCGDLFFQTTLLAAAERALDALIVHTADLRPLVAVGLPFVIGSRLYRGAAIISGGQLLGVVPSCAPPSAEINLCGELVPSGADLLFRCNTHHALTIGVGEHPDAIIQLQLAAEPEQIGTAEARRTRIAQQSARQIAAMAYAGPGAGESSTDLVFSGHALVAENGCILAETERFRTEAQLVYRDVDVEFLQKERLRSGVDTPNTAHTVYFRLPLTTRSLHRAVDPIPFLPPGPIDEHCGEIFALQTAALNQRLTASGQKTALLGISGGLDSTLALLVTVNAYDLAGRARSDILALTMPGFGTSGRTYENALRLMTELGVAQREISIKAACLQHFADIDHDPEVHDVTYENAQARERTQILMDLANKTQGLVIGTGNLSELALGWSTYGGDHMSMYAINAGVPKTVIQVMVRWLADSDTYGQTVSALLRDILDTPISPELLPQKGTGEVEQKTEDLIGPYILHDFFLYYLVRYGYSPSKILYLAEAAFAGRYDRETLLQWLELFCRRFFSQQFKRSCMPDGPQVGPISLSPRGGWHMPSDAAYAEWQREIEGLRTQR